MSRVLRMSAVGSPRTRRRSARCPGAIRPRSDILKLAAGREVAAASASVGGQPNQDEQFELLVETGASGDLRVGDVGAREDGDARGLEHAKSLLLYSGLHALTEAFGEGALQDLEPAGGQVRRKPRIPQDVLGFCE
jgi:hypothetical protein